MRGTASLAWGLVGVLVTVASACGGGDGGGGAAADAGRPSMDGGSSSGEAGSADAGFDASRRDAGFGADGGGPRDGGSRDGGDAGLDAGSTPRSIYWGAWIEGADTYSYLYGGSWGNAPWDADTWDRFESNAGKAVSIDHYGQPPPWAQDFVPSVADRITARGAIPLMDMSTQSESLGDLAAGSRDAALIAWADDVAAWGKPFFLRWDWEMNGTWFDWGAQAASAPATFVAAWRHVHDVVAGEGATNVTWVFCPNLEFTGSTPYDQLYPGDAYVDWTCLDGYDKDATSVAFADLYRASYDDLQALAPTKPIMIGEIGSLEYGPGDKAAWITDALGTELPTSFPQVKAVVWFNWRITESGRTWDWEIESSDTARAAFAAAIADPYYAAGGAFGSLPRLTKVQPID